MANNTILKITLNKMNNISVIDTAVQMHEFKVVGQFDKIKIEKLELIKDTDLLKQVYFDYLDTGMRKEINDVQVFYCCPENQEFNYDQFMKDKQWNYQFISFIDSMDFDINQDRFEGIYFFKSLDRSSYISMFRTNTITEGYKKIASIHFNKYESKINKTFTIMLINNEYHEELVIDDFIDYSINFKVDSPYILKKKIDDVLPNCELFYVLGNSDIQIKAENVSSNDFVKLIKNGILDIAKKEMKNSVRYVHSSIKVKLASDTFNESYKIVQNEEYKKAIVDLKEKISQYGVKDNLKKYYSIINNLLILLEEMYYENENNKYIILAVLPVLYECYTVLENSKKLDMLNGTLESVSQTIHTYLTSNLKTGHTSLYVPNLYYTPAKLIAFYNSYMRILNSVKGIHNEDKKVRYEFLILPRLHNFTDVKSFETIENKLEDRILVVHMPSENLFDIQSSIIILTHEAGHYLPNEIRNREERTKFLIKSTASTIFQMLMNHFNIDEEILKDVCKEIGDYCKRLARKVRIKFENIEEENKDYLIETEKYIRDEFIDRLQDEMCQLLFKVKNIYKDEMRGLAFNELIEKNLINNYMNLINPLSGFSIISFYSNYEYLLRECYSDLFAIELLKLSVDDYINTFINSFSKNYQMEETSIEKSLGVKVLNRISAVLYCEGWEIDDSNQNIQLKDDDKEFISHWIHIQKCIEANDYTTIMEDVYSLTGLQTRNIRKNFMSYLKKCRKSLEDVERVSPIKIQNTYKELLKYQNDENMLGILQVIDNTIAKCEKSFPYIIRDKTFKKEF